MIALAIESSCDETSLAIVQYPLNLEVLPFYSQVNSIQILSSIISSQIKLHANFGGVVPELGAREHAEQIHSLFQTVLQESKIDLKDLTHILVTTSPGLMSALRVGLEFARSVQYFLQKEYSHEVSIITVNHLQGHVASCFFDPNSNFSFSDKFTDKDIFPHLHLLVSGGNTQLRLLHSWSDWSIVGQTLDDAAGEAFDKAGRMMGIKYPAGATVDKIAGLEACNNLDLPVSMIKSGDCNFSFSGLKTAVRYKIQKANIEDLVLEQHLTQDELEQLVQIDTAKLNPKLAFTKNLCQSVQTVILKQIENKLKLAIKTYNPASIGLSGGVSASPRLRQLISTLANCIPVFIPDRSLSGDNAIMIALAGVIGNIDQNQ
jgi:N6-L-threonylcarbamoyladenine synthase